MTLKSHGSRSMNLLRALRWSPARVENWVPMPGHPGGGQRRDLWGFADLLCAGTPGHYLTDHRPEPRHLDCSGGVGMLAVQICSRTGLLDHVRKYHENQETLFAIRLFLRASPDNRFWIMSWYKKSVIRGGAQKLWWADVRVYFEMDDGNLGLRFDHTFHPNEEHLKMARGIASGQVKRFGREHVHVRYQEDRFKKLNESP